MSGQAGNDILTGGAGADTLDGGAGSDTANYAVSGAAVIVNLTTNINAGGDAAGDSLSAIENLIGSAYADLLTGDAGVNGLQGGAGADTLDGGAGIDYVSYATSASGVTVNMATGVNTGGDAQGDVLSGIEYLTGSADADVLTGDATGNIVEGGAGNDTLDGAGSTSGDELHGGTGDDVYLVRAVFDKVFENAGGGTDEIRSLGASYALGTSSEIERLTFVGTSGSFTGTGSGSPAR